MIFIIALSCLVSHSHALVINGDEVDLRDYPAVVSLQDENKESFCTGTAISPHHVLTAAHCLMGEIKEVTVAGAKNEVLAKVIQPSGNFSSPAFHLGEITLCIKEDSQFSPQMGTCTTMDEDFGIVEVESPLADYAKIAKTPSNVGESIHFVGYGLDWLPFSKRSIQRNFEMGLSPTVPRLGTNQIGELSSTHLRFEANVGDAKRTLSSLDNLGMETFKNFLSEKIAANRSGVSSGDSGGAIFNANKEIIGIVSYFDLISDENTKLVFDRDNSIFGTNLFSVYRSNALRTDTPAFKAKLREISKGLRHGKELLAAIK